MTRHFFIVNPAAGHGRAERLWQQFETAWQASLAPKVSAGSNALDTHHWRVERTHQRRHAADLAAAALEEGYDRIIAVGGDGTLSEVAGGLLGACRHRSGSAAGSAVLGHFPVGSGCDLARHFRLPNDPCRWPHVLSDATPQMLDAGRVDWTEHDGEHHRYFVNIAMAGLAGEIAHSMDRWGKPLGGVLSYLLASVLHVLLSRPKAIRLIADGGELPPNRYHLVALANTATTGGGMRIAPSADAADGLIDLVLLTGVPRRRLLWNFPRIYQGTHMEVEGVQLLRVKRLEAYSDETVLLNIDGEACGRLPARFEVLPAALRFLLPSSPGRASPA